MTITPETAEATLSTLDAWQIAASVAILAKQTPGVAYWSGPMADSLVSRLSERGMDMERARTVILGMVAMADTIHAQGHGEGHVEILGLTHDEKAAGDWSMDFTAQNAEIPVEESTQELISALGTLSPDALRPVLGRLIDKTDLTYVGTAFEFEPGEELKVTTGLGIVGEAMMPIMQEDEAVNLSLVLLRPGDGKGILLKTEISRLTPKPDAEPDAADASI